MTAGINQAWVRFKEMAIDDAFGDQFDPVMLELFTIAEQSAFYGGAAAAFALFVDAIQLPHHSQQAAALNAIIQDIAKVVKCPIPKNIFDERKS